MLVLNELLLRLTILFHIFKHLFSIKTKEAEATTQGQTRRPHPSFDSTFSYGKSWRVEGRAWQDTIGKANNPVNGFDFSAYNLAFPVPTGATVWDGQGSYANNYQVTITRQLLVVPEPY